MCLCMYTCVRVCTCVCVYAYATRWLSRVTDEYFHLYKKKFKEEGTSFEFLLHVLKVKRS